ncbi:MAG TPA: hypothetical protein VK914_11790 [bacterium]|jgi:hypothetical protein|nr:hypothetical protein [bacterium]
MTFKAVRPLLPLLLLLASPLRAYVTSAVFEYTVDDKASVAINGSPICFENSKNEIVPNKYVSDWEPFSFEALSTSDGSLDMSLFDPYHDNLLAVEDHDTEGDHISIAYRLTVNISDGDPIVVWSDPSQAKLLHLSKAEPDPDGWMRRDFDDSSWIPAVRGTELIFPFVVFPQLPDPRQPGGVVPRLSHNFNLKTNTQDHDLYRSHFHFPNHPAKVQALVNVMGKRVAVRLVPGPDSSDLSQFNILAWLPRGMQLTSAAPGYKWAPNLQRLSWSYNRDDLRVGYAKMPAEAVMDASGWSQADKALGPPKEGKTRRQLNVSNYLFNQDGARFTAHHPGWFKMAPHGVDLRWRPQILGVIFRAQMKLGGKDFENQTDTDAIYFNYSIDGTEHQALARDVQISHDETDNGYWFDAYYDASEDRKWTWEDLDKLAVKIDARAPGTVSTDMLASVQATVKYYVPAGASPWFYAQVTDPGCDTLQLYTASFSIGGQLLTDATDIPVNQQLCAPTPEPTATETPIPAPLMVIPTPAPTGVSLQADLRFSLGNMAANPNPFNYAGTFISFSVKKDVDVAMNVYSVDTGKVVRQMKATSFHAGDNDQIFFDAQDDQGNLLRSGSYLFELVATKNGHKETANATFQFNRGQ